MKHAFNVCYVLSEIHTVSEMFKLDRCLVFISKLLYSAITMVIDYLCVWVICMSFGVYCSDNGVVDGLIVG
jgi:hypothetical protein